MVFREDLSKKEFKTFISKNIGGFFTQNSAWGEFKEAMGGIKSYIVGMEDDNGNLVAASLLLHAYKRKIKNLYAPSGPVMDYTNKELVCEFFKHLKAFAKKIGAEVLEVEPAYVIREYNKNFEVTKEHDAAIMSNLLSVGFKHLGYGGKLTGYQLRHTAVIDLTQSKEEIMSKIGKNRQVIKRNEKYFNIEIVDGEEKDLEYLLKFRAQLSDKKHFRLEGLEHYTNLYKIFKKHEDARIMKAVINFKEMKKNINKEIALLEDELKTAKNKGDIQDIINSLSKKLKDIDDYVSTHDADEEFVGGVAVVLYIDKRVTYIYEHTDKELGNFGLPTLFLNEAIFDSKERGFEQLDMYGLASPSHKDNINYKVTEFKLSFGGNIIEYIGVFVMPIKKAKYMLKNTLRNISYSVRGIENERK